MNRLFLFCLIIFLTLMTPISGYSQETIIVKTLVTEQYDSNDQLKQVYNNQFIKSSVFPRRNTQPALIKIDLINGKDIQSKSYTSTDVLWFKKGKSRYHYTYEVDADGAILRTLWLYSDEFDNTEVCITVPSNYNDTGFVILNNFKGNKRTSYFISELSKSDARKLFIQIAKAVQNLDFPQRYQNTLYIDVDI